MTLFGTAGIRGPVADEVTPALALAVGQAAGSPGETFVVGRDGRETGPALAAAMVAGLESAGADVVRLGQVPTPALAFASRGRRGTMLTASHNPPADNGIKLFADGVEYDRDGEETIESRVESGCGPAAWDAWGTAEDRDVLSTYRDAVARYVRERSGAVRSDAIEGGDADDAVEEPDGTTDGDDVVEGVDGAVDEDGAVEVGAGPDAAVDEPLASLSIVVDCANGMGALATPQVLDRLGADVVALNANVDGHFPGRGSKPTPETLTDCSAVLADGDFDLGIAHDGDADRVVVLGPDGEVVHEDTILAVVAAHYVAAADVADPVVVTTPNASARIDERVREVGGRVERVRLGALHEGIAQERGGGEAGAGTGPETEVVFAAEPWKHVHTAFGGWIDGVASAAVVAALVAAAGGVDALRAPISERPYRKASVDCADPAKAGAMATLETTLPDAFPEATVETAYGVRLEFPDASWALVRPSGTEPYVRLYAESDDVDALIADVRETVESAVARSS